MTTVIEHLSAIVRATEERRAAGHAMTFEAGRELHRYAPELVHLAAVVDDFLRGDAPPAAVQGAFVPLMAQVEAAREATRS